MLFKGMQGNGFYFLFLNKEARYEKISRHKSCIFLGLTYYIATITFIAKRKICTLMKNKTQYNTVIHYI